MTKAESMQGVPFTVHQTYMQQKQSEIDMLFSGLFDLVDAVRPLVGQMTHEQRLAFKRADRALESEFLEQALKRETEKAFAAAGLIEQARKELE